MLHKLKYSPIYSYQDGLIINAIKFIDVNMVMYITTILIGFIINYKTNDCIIRTVLTYLAITLWTYYVHDIMHKYENSPIGKIHAIHHNSKYKDDISVEILEILVNVIIIGGLFWIPVMLWIENTIGFRIVNYYMILIWSFMFMTYHLINYHIYNADVHCQHHQENGENNYGPEWYDILFNTKAEHSKIEDMNSGVINNIILTFIVLYLKDTPYDLVDIFRKKVV